VNYPEPITNQTAHLAGNGISGGCAPKLKKDEVQDIRPYLPTSARHMWAVSEYYLNVQFFD
jgi:hypothetical protein